MLAPCYVQHGENSSVSLGDSWSPLVHVPTEPHPRGSTLREEGLLSWLNLPTWRSSKAASSSPAFSSPWKSGTTQVLAGRTVSHKAHRPSWRWVWLEHGQWTPSHPIQKKTELIRTVNGKWWKCQTLKDTLLRSTILKMLTKMVTCSSPKTISTNHKTLILYTTVPPRSCVSYFLYNSTLWVKKWPRENILGRVEENYLEYRKRCFIATYYM